MNSRNNTILLTGGTSGIGLELLRQLYDGNKLIVVSGNSDNLEKLKSNYPEITTVTCNLGDTGSVKQLLHKFSNEFDKINILINNAAVQYNYSFLKEINAFEKIEKEVTINLLSPLLLIYGLIPVLMEKDHAAIINISSGLAFSPKESAPVYCGTKAAVHNITKALRYQLEGTKIKVFEIIPPLVDTPLSKGSIKSKISPKQVVDEFLSFFQKDKLEIDIGKIKMLRILTRLAPKFADSLLRGG